MDLILTNLAPNRTASIQLYQRGTNTAVGSPIVGTSVNYTYTFSGVPTTGDYDCSLIGFTDPVGERFPVRNGIGYPGIPWSIVAATITTQPTYPTIVEGLSNVACTFALNGSALPGVKVKAFLDTQTNIVSSVILSQAILEATSDTGGNCVLRLVKYSEFSKGGIYRIRAFSVNKRIFEIRVKIPDDDDVLLADLVEDTIG